MTVTRRFLLVLLGIVGLALALAAMHASPRSAWQTALARAEMQHQAGAAFDVAGLAGELQAYLDADPKPKLARTALRSYFALVEKTATPQKELRALASHPNERISAMALASQRRQALLSEPVQLRFVALDGGVVDLQALRGNVVLLEFWATWCSTCMRELPNLKAVHEKYRDQGFEILGIALDDARDRQKLLAVLQKEGVTWPQYLPGDGHYATSEISEKFGVVGIPTTFLLDRRGMVSEINVRGRQLEPAVARALAVPGAT
jgi:thiol-disulfide isomerase/thioredoxin